MEGSIANNVYPEQTVPYAVDAFFSCIFDWLLVWYVEVA